MSINVQIKKVIKRTFGVIIAMALLPANIANSDPIPSNDQISPVGYNIIRGKQDISNPIENLSLLNPIGSNSTSSSQGTHWVLEQAIGFDTRQLINDTTRAPYRWIGKIDFSILGDKKDNCTGALISSDTVLTAGHCLTEDVSDIKFTPGLNADSAVFPTAQAVQIWRDKKLGETGKDWGIIKLNIPVGNEVGWFGMKVLGNEELQGKFATVIGYPTDKEKNTLWKGRNKITALNDKEVRYVTDTFGGQSGSPVMDDTAVIYAIHRGGTSKYNAGTRITNDLFNVIVNLSRSEIVHSD
jgi:glutamyl endopeptidase family protein